MSDKCSVEGGNNLEDDDVEPEDAFDNDVNANGEESSLIGTATEIDTTCEEIGHNDDNGLNDKTINEGNLDDESVLSKSNNEDVKNQIEAGTCAYLRPQDPLNCLSLSYN
jgi:hypothetical protein